MGVVSCENFVDLTKYPSLSPRDVLTLATTEKEGFSQPLSSSSVPTNAMNEQPPVTDVPNNLNKHSKPKSSIECPELPVAVREKISKLGDNKPRLVIQKKLTKCDVAENHSRVTMPVSESRIGLTKEEKRKLESRSDNQKVIGFRVFVIEPSLRLRLLPFKSWSYVNSNTYVLVKPWNDVVAYNELKEGDMVQFWSFRIKEINSLGFALVKIHNESLHQCSGSKRKRSA